MRSHTLAAALLLPLPAAAQDAPPSAGDDSNIIVIGQENKQQVHDFVKELTIQSLPDVPPNDPIARFSYEPTCPAAVGLGVAQDAAITARMRRVAEAAKVPLAPTGCKTNALVIFASNKDEMIKELQRKHPAYFTSASSLAVPVKKQPGPATAWQLSSYVDRYGTPVQYDADSGYYVLNTQTGPSRINSAVRPVILASVIVIDRGALDGLTTTQVADYAAMRSFTGADPSKLKKSTAPTILTVLDTRMNSEIPITLTQWDFNFLRAFYTVPENHNGSTQRAEIRTEVAKAIGKAED